MVIVQAPPAAMAVVLRHTDHDAVDLPSARHARASTDLDDVGFLSNTHAAL